MDQKAFNKIVEEAEEAIAERRFLDAVALTEAIFKDSFTPYAAMESTELRKQYLTLLQSMDHLSGEKRRQQANDLFVRAIETLQLAREFWLLDKDFSPKAGFPEYREQTGFLDNTVVPLLIELTQQEEGTAAYFDTLDKVFVGLWCPQLTAEQQQMTANSLQQISSFARRTLVGALLLGEMDYFSVAKIQLLLSLARPHEEDSSDERLDLLARVAVALTIISQRYEHFLAYYPHLRQQMRAFFESEEMLPHLDELLQAFSCQTAVDKVGNRVNDINSYIQKFIQTQQPHLGFDDEGKEGRSADSPLHFNVFKIDEEQSEQFFSIINDQGTKLKALISHNLDINAASFLLMKSFRFFNTPPHWFYPFSANVPAIKEAFVRPNGKPDRMISEMMKESHYCASDCYSYASMLLDLRNRAHQQKGSWKDFLKEQLDELRDSMEDFSFTEQTYTSEVNPFTDYCQSLYRYFYSARHKKDYTYAPFRSKGAVPLPLQPLFKGLFTDFTLLQPALDSLAYIGSSEQVIILTDYAIEHFGADAQLLFMRGTAQMHLQRWQKALSAFQQVLLFDENPEAELHMARCFEAMSNWEQALPLLIKEEERQTKADEKKAANIIEETGRCLIQLKRWNEAAQRFYRLEYMERHLNVARRAIAWCSIQQGKYERAINYYTILIEQKKATWEDLLNCGHAQWLTGATSEAISTYHQSYEAFNRANKNSRLLFKHWSEAFRADISTILSTRYDEAECALMMDAAGEMQAGLDHGE
ncbi:MAG: tetratricopeptide repeat protein [Bacteroidales bacterium]|nr:tetratricopeptide repeat protein [Bacteroidales bacterium]